jgi:RNA polymerase sigma-70 factor (ECF subfamily)
MPSRSSDAAVVAAPQSVLVPPRPPRRAASGGRIAVYPRPPMEPAIQGPVAAIARTSQAWLDTLRADGLVREEAIADLHALLLRAARFELGRRRAALSYVRGEELEDLATQAADDALIAVLAKLDDYRGASRFTTWAYKFALLEAGVRLRRRAWQGREVVLEPEAWPTFEQGGSPAHETVERGELLGALRQAIDTALTPHQRDVFVALALKEIPIDVLAERLNATRGALYKTLHDARRKLRSDLLSKGFGGDDDDHRLQEAS